MFRDDCSPRPRPFVNAPCLHPESVASYTMLKSLMYKWSKLEAATGMMSNGSAGSGTVDSAIGAVVLGSIIGALVGMIGGFILSNLLRLFAMIYNRPLGGYSWVMVGTVVGALIFAIMALSGDKN